MVDRTDAGLELPSAKKFGQAILEGKVDPIGVLTYGRESLPADFVLNAKFEEAKAAEQSALNKVNDYVATYFGSLDLRDPAELKTLKANASEATRNREALQAQVEAQEYADNAFH